MKNLTDFPMWKSRKQIQWHNESQAGIFIYVGSSRLLNYIFQKMLYLSTWPNVHSCKIKFCKSSMSLKKNALPSPLFTITCVCLLFRLSQYTILQEPR